MRRNRNNAIAGRRPPRGGVVRNNQAAAPQQQVQQQPVQKCSHVQMNSVDLPFKPSLSDRHGFADPPHPGDDGLQKVAHCGQLKLLLLEFYLLVRAITDQLPIRVIIVGGSPGHHLPMLFEGLCNYYQRIIPIEFALIDPVRPKIEHQVSRVDTDIWDPTRFPHRYMWFPMEVDPHSEDPAKLWLGDILRDVPGYRTFVINDMYELNIDPSLARTNANQVTNRIAATGKLLHGKFFCDVGSHIVGADLLFQPFSPPRSTELRATNFGAMDENGMHVPLTSDDHSFLMDRLYHHVRYRRTARTGGTNNCFDCYWKDLFIGYMPNCTLVSKTYYEFNPKQIFKVDFEVTKDLGLDIPGLPLIKGKPGIYHPHGDEAAIRRFLHSYACNSVTSVNGLFLVQPKILDFGGNKRRVLHHPKHATYDETLKDQLRLVHHDAKIPFCRCALRSQQVLGCACNDCEVILTQDKIYYRKNQQNLCILMETLAGMGKSKRVLNIFMRVEDGFRGNYPAKSNNFLSCLSGQVVYQPFGNEEPYKHKNYELKAIQTFNVGGLNPRTIRMAEKVILAVKRGPITYYITEWTYLDSSTSTFLLDKVRCKVDSVLGLMKDEPNSEIVADNMLDFWFISPNRKDWKERVPIPGDVLHRCSKLKVGMGTNLGTIHSAGQSVQVILTEWQDSLPAEERYALDIVNWLAYKLAATLIKRNNNNVYSAASRVNADEGSRIVQSMVKTGDYQDMWHTKWLDRLYVFGMTNFMGISGFLLVLAACIGLYFVRSIFFDMFTLLYLIIGVIIIFVVACCCSNSYKRFLIRCLMCVGCIKPVVAYSSDIALTTDFIFFSCFVLLLLCLYLFFRRKTKATIVALYEIPRKCITDKQWADVCNTNIDKFSRVTVTCPEVHVCDPLPRPKSGIKQIFWTWGSREELKPPISFHHCSMVECHALKNRQLKELPKPEPRLLDAWRPFVDFINEIISCDIGDLQLLPFAEWVAHFPGRKRGFIISCFKGEIELQKYLEKKINYDGFPKLDEKAIDDGPKGARPRWVSGPPNWHKIVVGPFFYTLSRELEKYLPGYCVSKTFGEISVVINEALFEFRKPVIFKGDGGSFDSCQSFPVLDCTDKNFYDKVINRSHNLLNYDARIGHETFERCVYWSDHKGFGKFHKYTCKGRQASGKSNTTEGNTRRECCYMLTIAFAAGILKRFFLLCKGDDCIAILEEEDVPKFEAYRRQLYTTKATGEGGLGQVMIDGCYTKLDDMDFCSARFMPYNGFYRMIRMPERVVKLDSWTISPLVKTVEDAKAQCWAVGNCGLDWAKDVPIFDSWYNALVRCGSPDARVLQEMREQELWQGKARVYGRRTSGIAWDSRQWFEKYYNISASEQIWIETVLDNLEYDHLGTLPLSGVWERLVNPDFSGLQTQFEEIRVPDVNLTKTLHRRLDRHSDLETLAKFLRGEYRTKRPP